MTKEEWVKLKQQPHFPMWAFFEYYEEKGGYIKSFPEFENIFVQLVAQHAEFVKSPKSVFRITYETAISRMSRYFDMKFGTTE